MNRLELAEQRYREIVTRQRRDLEGVERVLRLTTLRPQIAQWLNDDVARAVEQLWRRPRFQEIAAWPQRHLAPGVQTAERQLVDQLSEALAHSASALLKLAIVPRIAKELPGTGPPQRFVANETVEITEEGSKVLDRRFGSVVELPILQAQVQAIASRDWELVCVDDYLAPSGDWRGGHDRRQILASTPGSVPVQFELHPFFNPNVLPVGDLITRMMLARIQVHVESLRALRPYVLKSLRSSGSRSLRAAGLEVAAWEDLQTRHTALKRCVQDPQAPMREAAATLAQVFISLRPDVDTDWLSLSPYTLQLAPSLERSLMNVTDLNALDRLAAALHEVRYLSDDPPSEQSALAEALERYDLVLTEDPPAMYWKGRQIPIPWGTYPQQWRFWLALAKNARFGRWSGIDDIYARDEFPSFSGLYSLKSRADMQMCDHATELAKAIDTRRGETAYRLNLPSDKVHVIPRAPGARDDLRRERGAGSRF